MTDTTKPVRPEFRNINLFTDVRTYRMPLAAIVSILHRLSGLVMLAFLPFVVWLFDKSVSSEISFGEFTSAFSAGIGFIPGWFVKLVTLLIIWAYLHHFCVGLRHLYMDVTHRLTKEFGRHSAVAALVISLTLTVVLGAKLFGLY
jgi:succinate dehydrogenase / fumarate reductase cytochrome b subunit